jgi:hypothetical protein
MEPAHRAEEKGPQIATHFEAEGLDSQAGYGIQAHGSGTKLAKMRVGCQR